VRPRLIISADDFGLHPALDAGILRCAQAGVVTSVGWMATGSNAETAAKLAKDRNLDVGLHFTLVGEKWLTRKDILIGSAPHLFNSLLRRSVRPRDIEAELNAQLEFGESLGLHFSHIDTHQHTHVLGPVSRAIASSAYSRNIFYLRNPAESLSAPCLSLRRALERIAVNSLWGATRSSLRLSNLKFPNQFFGFGVGGHLTQAHIRKFVSRMRPDCLTELMTHPGDQPASATPWDSWGYRWQAERDALLASSEMLANLTELTSFRNLAEGSPNLSVK
jgi:predicted glycoside hydrolase/deacetylase ChbG (UPF0249 family)